MKIPQPWKCDYCLNIKGPSNHWWLFIPDAEVTAELDSTSNLFVKNGLFAKWDEVIADLTGVEHICSESCGAKALSKWMGKASGNVKERLDLDGNLAIRRELHRIAKETE
jgi:hypothetical protein